METADKKVIDVPQSRYNVLAAILEGYKFKIPSLEKYPYGLYIYETDDDEYHLYYDMKNGFMQISNGESYDEFNWFFGYVDNTRELHTLMNMLYLDGVPRFVVKNGIGGYEKTKSR
jgi:hypothetical protein